MQSTYPDLEGKVVVITGAAQGIGKAIAREFAKQRSILIIDDLPAKKICSKI